MHNAPEPVTQNTSSLLAELVTIAFAVVARPGYATSNGTLTRLRARLEAEAASPRSVGLIDEATLALIDALDHIGAKHRADDARALRTWCQVAGVLLPIVQEDILAALRAERGQ